MAIGMCPISSNASVFIVILLLMHSHHTMESKSMMCTSLMKHPAWFPPQKTACCSLIAVNVKPEHGGGLGPVVGGEDHLPAEGEAV